MKYQTSIKKKFFFITLFFLNFAEVFSQKVDKIEEKILICGVCRNTAFAVKNTIENIENLGSRFKSYKAIIYENDSSDDTASLYQDWALDNSSVIFVSENLKEKELSLPRTVRIANGRNKVLNIVRMAEFNDYKYLIMVDLDFITPWPIEEIIKTLRSSIYWDCVSANGIRGGSIYYDRYAFRSSLFPFGPEVLGDDWWGEINPKPIKLKNKKWRSVHSAFGGLAIYKTETIKQFRYSGVVTKDLKVFYKNLLLSMDRKHDHFQKYLKLHHLPLRKNAHEIPILFAKNTSWECPSDFEEVTCCEHVPLHASMLINGYINFFVNPKLIMYYK